jgi:hypothetical protein
LIEESFSPDNSTQQMVFQKLQQIEMQSPDQLCINLSVLMCLQTCKNIVRQVAGLTLKAQIEKNFAMLQVPTLEFLKQQLQAIFMNSEPKIARIIS